MVTKIPFNGLFRISQPFNNMNYELYGNKPHTGVDMVGESSVKIYGVMESGQVVYTGYEENGFGNYIKVKDNATGNFFYFAHLKAIYVNEGNKVTYTTVLGLMGSTGNSTGPHLHFEIRKSDNKTRLDPCVYMGIPNKRGRYNSTDYGIKTEEEKKQEELEKQEEIEEMKALEKCAELEKRINMLVSENAELKKQLEGKQDKPKVRTTPYDWEKEGVSYCVEQGIIKGDGEKIDLSEPVSMGKMAVMLYRVMMHIKKWFVKKQDCKCFKDSEENS